MRLSNKSVIVTGAGRGIGRAIALALAGEGANVCCAARTRSEVEATAKEIESLGGKGLAIATDVTDWNSVTAMVDAAVAEFGGLDIAVLNAGVLLDVVAHIVHEPDKAQLRDGDGVLRNILAVETLTQADLRDV